MRAGDTVGYFTEDGVRHQATVTAVVGKGKSNFKTLDLSYKKDGESVAAEQVPHENDAKEGEPFWLETGVRRKKAEPPPESNTQTETPRSAPGRPR